MSVDPPKEDKSEEFRRYRQVLAAVYIVVGGGLGLLLLCSVVAELFFRRAPGGAKELAPMDQLQCNDAVRTLLEELGDNAASIQREAVHANVAEIDVGGRWDEFSRRWQRQWEQVNARCRFDELADTDLGPAYNRMAWVHRQLPKLKLQYKEQIKRFTDNQADELAEMRKALDSSRRLLEQRAHPPR